MVKPATSRATVIPVLAEAFREHGYGGASMAILQDATGLGRGSLYHFFPGGKEEMATAVLADIRAWFHERVFEPLRSNDGTARAAGVSIRAMFAVVDTYFRSGQRVCLPGAFALGRERDRFVDAVCGYFIEWVDALTAALNTAGTEEPRAHAIRIVATIQGGITLSRALNDPHVFEIALNSLRAHWTRDTANG